MNNLKYCPNCKKEKSVTDFYTDVTKVDGYATNCICCKNRSKPSAVVRLDGKSIDERIKSNIESKQMQENWLKYNAPKKGNDYY